MTVIFIAMGANITIACAKFAAAALTGSSAMFSEAIHSLVDSSNQVLLLTGIKRAQKKADEKHPFGYSKELYFWSFIVAILLFSLGAGVSLYEGIEKFFHPHPIKFPEVIYIVLGIAIGMEGFSTYKALAEFRKRHTEKKLVRALQKSKDPALFAIVLEDMTAMVGLFAALIGVLISDKLGYLPADGIASIIIAIMLASVAVFMSIEIKGLIIGEAADPEVQKGIFNIIMREATGAGPILAINEIRTMHLGPTDILLACSVDFRDGIAAEEIEATTHKLEQTIKEKYPSVRKLFIEVQSIASHAMSLRREAELEGHPKDKVKTQEGATRRSKQESTPAPGEEPVAPAKQPEPSIGETETECKNIKKAPDTEITGSRTPDLASLPLNRKARKNRRKAHKRAKKKR